MIQQPALGKKISDLRKAKNLTQEELVEKCNLSVRTLQRIEAGEVIPRPITVKLIFEALGYSLDEITKERGLKRKRLEQFYISFIDLFNLKTDTMKKISILTVMFSAILFGITSFYNVICAQNEIKKDLEILGQDSPNDTIYIMEYMVSGVFDGWNNDEELIARDVYCSINGVWIKTPLIRLNKKTNEFRTPCITGIISESKVEIIDMECQPIERIVSNVTISDDKFNYKGKLVFSGDEFIEAPVIIVNRD